MLCGVTFKKAELIKELGIRRGGRIYKVFFIQEGIPAYVSSGRTSLQDVRLRNHISQDTIDNQMLTGVLSAVLYGCHGTCFWSVI